ncbi:MAG TPA: hypothetical protein VK166_15925 [Chitinophagaceae bacterium]|nr:hypothetical protein [Chitinophagaceae bacterium]
MKHLFLFALLIGSYFSARSQNLSTHASQAYFELFGAAGGVSLNYDARFSKKENGLGYRVGIGGGFLYSSSFGTSITVAVPVGLNYLFGTRKHYFELGGGASPFFGDEMSYPKNYFGVNLSAGYRLTPFQKKGVSFRAGYMQWVIFANGTDFTPYLYLSVGYRF